MQVQQPHKSFSLYSSHYYFFVTLFTPKNCLWILKNILWKPLTSRVSCSARGFVHQGHCCKNFHAFLTLILTLIWHGYKRSSSPHAALSNSFPRWGEIYVWVCVITKRKGTSIYMQSTLVSYPWRNIQVVRFTLC